MELETEKLFNLAIDILRRNSSFELDVCSSIQAHFLHVAQRYAALSVRGFFCLCCDRVCNK